MTNLYKVTYKAVGKKQTAYVLALSFGEAEVSFEKKITNHQIIINIEFLAQDGIYNNPNPLIR